MNIEEQFNLIAQEYDCNRRKFIPCFDDFYRNTTQFIVSNIDETKRIIEISEKQIENGQIKDARTALAGVRARYGL